MKTTRSTSCAVWWCTTSKMDRRIRPNAPMTAKMMAQIDSDFWTQEVLCARRPLCLSHLSAMKTTSNTTTQTVEPAIKRGCSPWAPTSEIYAIFWFDSMLT